MQRSRELMHGRSDDGGGNKMSFDTFRHLLGSLDAITMPLSRSCDVRLHAPISMHDEPKHWQTFHTTEAGQWRRQLPRKSPFGGGRFFSL